MQVLFIGHTYIDVTFLTDHVPTGDEKHVASAYAISFGGNAVTAAFCCAKLAIAPDLITTIADDWLGRMFLEMAAKYGIFVHPRRVHTSSLSFIMPKDGKRAIVRCRDDAHFHPFPDLDLAGCRALHVDGHQPDAAIHYAKLCRDAGILTSLDGGGLRANTDALLAFIDVAVVAERMCEQMGLSPPQMLDYLKRPRLPHRRRDPRRERIAVVRRAREGAVIAGAARSAGADPRHQRRGRRLSRRVCLLLPRRSGQSSGKPISISPAPPPRTRSSISATKPASRPSPTSKRSGRGWGKWRDDRNRRVGKAKRAHRYTRGAWARADRRPREYQSATTALCPPYELYDFEVHFPARSTTDFSPRMVASGCTMTFVGIAAR